MPGCRRRCIQTTVAAAALTSLAHAQIDASWIGPAAFVNEPVFAAQPGPVNVLNQGHDWTSEPDWSTPPFPTGAGAATIASPANVDSQGRIIITLDTDVMLRELSLSNTTGVDITDTQPAINAVLQAAPQGLTIRSARYHPDAPSRATYHGSGNSIAVPIGGAGALSVTGGSIVTFTKANTFTGALSVTSGVLAIGGGAGGLDARLGASSTPVLLDAGTIRATHYGSSAATLNRAFALGPAGGTFAVASSNPFELNGIISGSGAMRIENDFVRLNAVNTYTGATIVAGDGLLVSGSIRPSSSIDVIGQLQIAHAIGAATVDRLGDAAPITLRGATLAITSADPLPYRESVGTIIAAGGVSTIRFGAIGVSINSPAVQREDGGGVFIDGPLIGAGGATLAFANGANLTIGPGGSGTARGIVPWMWAYQGIDTGVHNGAGRSSLVTYGATGARPLDLLTEYHQSFALAQSGENVRITSSQSLGPNGKVINALLLGSVSNADNGTPSTLTGGPISVTSGAILNTTRGNLIFNDVNFGDAEGVIISASTAGAGGDQGLGIWGTISGNNGLTKLGPGNLFLVGANTYVGPTTIAGGRVTIDGEVLPFVPGPLGQSDAPIVLVAGGTLPGATEPGGATRLASQFAGGTLTIGRPIIVRGATHAQAAGAIIDSTSDAGIVRLTGGVELQSASAPLAVTRGSIRFDSPISGPGSFRDAGAATITFAAASPQWNGAVEMGLNGSAATYVLSADQSLGTGTIFVGAAAMTTVRTDGGARIIDNPVTFALAAAGSAITFDGELRFTGPLDFGGNIGRPIVVAEGANLTISGAAGNGSFRLLAARFGNDSTGGTLTIDSATEFNGRIFIGAAAYQSPQPLAATPGGTLRMTHSAALGRAGVQIDADGSTLQIDGADADLLVNPTNAFIRGGGAGERGAIHNSAGDNTWRGNIALIADATIGVAAGSTLRVDGAIADLSAATAGFGNAGLAKAGPGTLIVQRLANSNLATGGYGGPTARKSRLDAVRINEGRVVINDLPGARRADQVSVVRELSIAAQAQLNLGDAALIVDYGATTSSETPFTTIESLVRSGYAGGSWNGFGIASSAADNTAGLALVDAADLFGSFPATFLGREIDQTSLIVSFTLTGDSDINGIVDLGDFATLAAHFNQPGAWVDGDSNYDRQVGLGDFALMAQNFNQTLTAIERHQVPEPGGALSLLSTIIFRRPRSSR